MSHAPRARTERPPPANMNRFEGSSFENMATEVAASYRQAILAAGGSKPAAELCRDFLGREYSTGPFEDWLNRG